MTKISDFKFGVILAVFAFVLAYFIMLDSNITINTKEVILEGQTLQCIPSEYRKVNSGWICFGNKDLFWGMTYYAPILAIHNNIQTHL